MAESAVIRFRRRRHGIDLRASGERLQTHFVAVDTDNDMFELTGLDACRIRVPQDVAAAIECTFACWDCLGIRWQAGGRSARYNGSLTGRRAQMMTVILACVSTQRRQSTAELLGIELAAIDAGAWEIVTLHGVGSMTVLSPATG